MLATLRVEILDTAGAPLLASYLTRCTNASLTTFAPARSARARYVCDAVAFAPLTHPEAHQPQ
jgi:hypothetical protein